MGNPALAKTYEGRVLEVVPRGGVPRPSDYDVKVELKPRLGGTETRVEVIPLADIPRAYRGMEFVVEVYLRTKEGKLESCFKPENITYHITEKHPPCKNMYGGVVHKVSKGKVHATLLHDFKTNKRIGRHVKIDNSKVVGECIPCEYYPEDEEAEAMQITHIIEQLTDGNVLIRPAFPSYRNWVSSLATSILLEDRFGGK